MPLAFENCRRNGGKLRTVSGPNKQFGLKEGQYIHICILDNKVFRGEVKTKQKEGEK